MTNRDGTIHPARVLGVGLLVAAVCGCGEPAYQSPGAEASADEPAAESSARSGEHVAIGTLNSIDLGSGRVNITHEFVESIGMPAMTMDFTLASPDVAAGLTPGQRVRFYFTTEGGVTVTRMEALE